MRKILKWVGISLGSLLLLGAGVMTYRIGPSNVIGLIRYDQREEGTLKVGDQAPDVELVALDGGSPQQLRGWTGEKPVVLVFGSFT